MLGNFKDKVLIPVGLQFCAFSYNLNTVVLYFSSADHFSQHMGWTKDPLTQIPASWTNYPLGVVLAFDGVLLLTNQLAFPKRLAQLLDIKVDASSGLFDRRWIQQTQVTLSSFFKATVSSSSLLALLNEYLPFSVSLGIMVILLPGNFASQFSILFEPFLRRLQSFTSTRLSKMVSNYSSAAYAISNAALYYNTANRAPRDLSWTSEMVSSESTTMGRGLSITFILLSLQFIYATWYSFSRRIHEITKPERGEDSDEEIPLLGGRESEGFSFVDRCTLRAVTASLWKASVTTLALIACFDSYDQPELGYIVSALLFFGNALSQLTLYASSDQEIRERTPWCGFFRKPTIEDADDLASEINERRPLFTCGGDDSDSDDEEGITFRCW